MSIVSKTSAGAALVLVALLLCHAGYAATPAVAQYDAPPESQYDLPARGQYAPPPEGTTPLHEDQNGGGTTNGGNGGTTAPLDGGNDGGGDDREDGAATARASERPSGNAGVPKRLDGVLVDGLKLLAALSVVATLLFFVERHEDRRGL